MKTYNPLLRTVLSLFLVCLLLVPLASCGKGKKTDATEPLTGSATDPNPSSGTTAGETTPESTRKWYGIGEAVSAYAASDRTLLIEYDMFVSPENSPKNNIYIQGPDEVVSGVTSSIEELVYNRNKAAADLLGVTMSYTYWDDLKWARQADRIKTVVQGNAVDAPDLFVNMIYDLNIAMKSGGGIFKDVTSIPGAYFDFEVDGWMKDWMESLSFTTDRAYILGGDYFIDILRAMGVLPFNLDLMDANADKLAAAIIDEDDELGVNEKLSTRFFDLVEQEQWTWEVLGKLCAAIWVDVDGSGSNTTDDLLGIITDRYSGLPGSIIIFSAGESLTETYKIEDPTSEYNGKYWVRYNETPGAVGAIFDAVAGVFSGAGAFVTNDFSNDGSGFPFHYSKFASDELLFVGPSMIGTLEQDAFQQMHSTYSVVPMPKVSADKKYNTPIHSTADAGAINVNTSPDKTRALSAYLQHCNENSGEIRKYFLQVVTKYKTTTYNQGTDRMLDLIYDNLTTGRDMALEFTAEQTSDRRTVSVLKGQGYVGDSAFLAATYEANLSKKQSNLDSVLEKWYALPTGATETPAE